jgi:hypothetical protein
MNGPLTWRSARGDERCVPDGVFDIVLLGASLDEIACDEAAHSADG